MTGAQPPPNNIPNNIYPQYCFHLSPTINRWCPLRAADIQALEKHPGFEGQDLYFHDNHPIKWVRIVGIVVAIDEYAARRIYTVDDSSGATIECVVNITQLNTPGPPALARQKDAKATAASASASTSAATTKPDIDADIDVGDILDARGSIRLFRNAKQVRVEKIIHLRSTEQEMRFWNKLTQFRMDVLNTPWALDKREVRRCRKEAEGQDEVEGRKRRRRRAAEAERSSRGPAGNGTIKCDDDDSSRRSKTTGLEKRARRGPKIIRVEGKYGALGI